MYQALDWLFETWHGGYFLGLLVGFGPLILDWLGVIDLA